MELDAESRRVLSLVHDARTPSAQDKERVEKRLALALGLSGAAAAAVTPTTAAEASAGAHASAGAGAGKVAGVGAALKWVIGGCAVVVAALASHAALSGPARREVARERAVVPAVAPRAPALPEEPAVEVETETAPETDHAVGHKVAARRAQPHARAATGDSLGAELELLHAAQSAWRAGDAARALTLVAEHRQRHPRSALGLERDALRVLALCDLGRGAEAAPLARAWLARAGGSPLRASIEHSCALK